MRETTWTLEYVSEFTVCVSIYAIFCCKNSHNELGISEDEIHMLVNQAATFPTSSE